MKIIFAISSQYYESEDGVYMHYIIIRCGMNILKVLMKFLVLAPLKKVNELPTGCKRADNKNVKFIDSSAIKKKTMQLV